MINKQSLLQQIDNRSAQVGIMGLGYVGLPLAVAFAQVGFHVIGFDVATEKVNQLKAGHSYIEDVPDAVIRPLIENDQLHITTDPNDLASVQSISICVPTPLRKTGDPDISYIISATQMITAFGGNGKLIVLESTTYPGTTEEVILPQLSQNGATVGTDFFLAFSPERIDPGRKDYNIFNTPKVIGGVTSHCLDIANALYGTIVQQVVPVSSTATAELVKLLENTFRAVNIGLVNEMALICDKLGLNVWEVVQAASTKPYGFMPFYPGPGLGGHCIPVDPHYLSWKLRTMNYTARFIELASAINTQMPLHVVSRVADALNDVYKPIKGSHLLVLGVTYKPNVSDTRESPALDIIQLLQERGAIVFYHDPYASTLVHDGLNLESIHLTNEALAQADCVIVITDHHNYDWQQVINHASLIVDTRNALSHFNDTKVISL